VRSLKNPRSLEPGSVKETTITPKLTIKQARFCVAYFKGGCSNATEAALAAGYKPKTARAIASENLTKPNIIQKISHLRAAVDTSAVASVQERKEILTQIARGKLIDFCECGEDGVWFNIGPETLRSAALASVTSKTVIGKDGADDALFIHAELRNPVDAIKELNKMDGVYPSESIDITSKGKQINTSITQINIGEIDVSNALAILVKAGAVRLGATEDGQPPSEQVHTSQADGQTVSLPATG
jgi:phage terminase small subunit